MTEKYDKKFKDLFGFYLCFACKTKLYKNEDYAQFQNINKHQEAQSKDKVNLQNEVEDKEDEEDEEDEMESVSSEKDEKYVCKSVDNKNKRLRLATAIQEVIMVPPAKKLILNISDADNAILQKPFTTNNLNISSDMNCDNWISDFKVALSRVSTRVQEIVLLTTVSVTWSNRETAKVFGVSRRMVNSAKKLKDNNSC